MGCDKNWKVIVDWSNVIFAEMAQLNCQPGRLHEAE